MAVVALPDLPLSTFIVDVSVFLGVCLLPLLALRKNGPQKAFRHVRLLALGLLPLLALSLWSRDQNTVEYGGRKIRVEGAFFFGQVRDVDEFDLATARVVQGGVGREIGLGLRVSGISTPGFHAGTFRIADGRSAFLLVMGDHPAVVLPAKVGPWLVLTVKDPQVFLDGLRAAH